MSENPDMGTRIVLLRWEAGLSTALRFGRDDTFVVGREGKQILALREG